MYASIRNVIFTGNKDFWKELRVNEFIKEMMSTVSI